VAQARVEVDHGGVQYTDGSFLVGPLIAFAVVGVLVLALRWTFARGGSVVAKPAKSGRIDEYGLLVSVAAPSTYIEAEIVRRTLEDHHIRATLAQTLAGPRIMVFPQDADRARQLVSGT
jgi:hypothetical protein